MTRDVTRTRPPAVHSNSEIHTSICKIKHHVARQLTLCNGRRQLLLLLLMMMMMMMKG